MSAYTYTAVHAYTCTHTCMYTGTYAHMCTYTGICAYACMYTGKYAYIHTQVYVHTSTHTQIYVHTHISVCTHRYTCIHVHTCRYTCIHMHIQVHMHVFNIKEISFFILFQQYIWACMLLAHHKPRLGPCVSEYLRGLCMAGLLLTRDLSLGLPRDSLLNSVVIQASTPTLFSIRQSTPKRTSQKSL